MNERIRKVALKHCPTCDAKLDSAVHVAGTHRKDEPHAGDLSLCYKCGAMLIFVEGGGLRLMEEPDFAKMPPRARVELEGMSRKVAEWSEKHFETKSLWD